MKHTPDESLHSKKQILKNILLNFIVQKKEMLQVS